MPRLAKKNVSLNGAGALGFEATLWSAAEKLKGNMDAAEYKHVVLGLIFLKYISDAFEEKHAALAKDKTADPEDRDEYTADNIFWVNKIARWSYLQGRAAAQAVLRRIARARRTITGKNRFRRNTVCFWNDKGLHTMNGMYGTRPPFQGFGFVRGIVPRPLPRAGLDRPLGLKNPAR